MLPKPSPRAFRATYLLLLADGGYYGSTHCVPAAAALFPQPAHSERRHSQTEGGMELPGPQPVQLCAPPPLCRDEHHIPCSSFTWDGLPRLQRNPAIYNLGHGKISMQQKEEEEEEGERERVID
ncbi:hypothetical protein Q8A73_020650 [Channa argus]|nr:hypothetical protein Q8A73_020650 [Channa argus]